MYWHLNILGTHEEEQQTSLGDWPGDDFLGVALPSPKALKRSIVVEYKGTEVTCVVGDVGPWVIDDQDYVLGEARPRAEILKGKFCPRSLQGGNATVPDGNNGFIAALISNGAGIDLFPGTAKALGIPIGENVLVSWSFVDS